MENKKIRLAARGAGVPLWKLAAVMQISEATLFRRLRKELTEEENKLFLEAIEQAKGGAEHDTD